ncbi:MAG: cryptochrome/photolyase family protein [Candidatus Nanopelagicales bacterium]
MPAVAWFRRDLRLGDNPALGAAAAVDGTVVPLFVFDPALWGPAGDVRRAYLVASLRSLDADLGGNLLLQHGDPVDRVVEVARAAGAREVHIAADYAPYGSRRDEAVRTALAEHGIELIATGSPYAVAPGRVTKDDGTAYRVYTPFYKAWLRHGWRAPAPDVTAEYVMPVDCHGYLDAPDLPFALPPAGEEAALQRWARFREDRLTAYDATRNLPAMDGTSAMSHSLRWGEIHPRTMLADLGDTDAEDVFRKEIVWREFYANVLHQRPESARKSLDARFDDDFAWDSGAEADRLFEAWATGRTGFPFVDAGMRQLLAEGWMHNRVRMIVASFLVKDLHLPWQRGAAHFMRWLRDGDLASNSHGWQWTAGCGTDASPYYRVFNPVGQGEKFDPEGDYVRRYVPELAHLPGKSAHAPWDALGGYDHGYPERIVDHAAERVEALDRFAAMKAARS